MKKKWARIPLSKPDEAAPVLIAGDAAISQRGLGEGKLIPLLILDTTNRPDIDELIRVHEYVGPGDVVSQWGRMSRGQNVICLILRFQRPSQITIIIQFDIARQGVLVDQALAARAVYLQAGRHGDRFLNTPHARRILVEVVEGGFSRAWDRMYYKLVASDMRVRGLNRSEAKRAARQVIDEMRKLRGLARMPA